MGYIMDLRKVVGSRPLIMVGACVILLNKNHEILLQLRKDNNCWGLAGGSLEMGETLEQVAKRELWEETGLVANKLQLFNVFSGEKFYYKYPHGDEVYNVVTAYICNDYDGDLVVDESEVQALSFFDLNSLPTNISPPDLPILQEYINKLKYR
ncbi:NUDIX hydrolase [Peribacillus acanthi]|uniref:NUDIX hydrolase n=1 Tax=Peribacillus acanthi TaxID=2171554 RepID=UPI000D3ED0C7|nr:NUDIX hydrolase [Peribacillus acanthi]